MKKIILVALLVTLCEFVFGIITCGGMFNWIYSIEPTTVWKPMESTLVPGFYIFSIVLNLIFVKIYTVLSKGIDGTKITKGLKFAAYVWALGILPGMFATYYFMTVATTVVIYWIIVGLINLLLKGLIVSAIFEK